MDLSADVVALVTPHPAIRSIAFVGSRAQGTATEFSDWDFRVEAEDFAAAADGLPELLSPLRPLAEQWDRLSSEWCWMLILSGPAKVDLIFPDEPHTTEGPWEPRAEMLTAMDAHFWDWMLWLRGKAAHGNNELIGSELQKMFGHLLSPMGVERPPSSLSEAIAAYRDARNESERHFDVVVPRHLDNVAAPLFDDVA